MSKRALLFLIATVLIVGVALAFPDPASAAPGGAIASAIFRSPLGRILLVFLVIIFAPFIAYIMAMEAKASKRTLAALESLSSRHPEFEWFALKNRITEVFGRVHTAWGREDMQEASDWVTHWYWQNQQIVHLDKWEAAGLVNRCTVQSIDSIRPLFLKYANENGSASGTRVFVGITATMEDYLAEKATGNVVEGKPGYTSVASVWTFVLQDGQWMLDNIEPGGLTLEYAKMTNKLATLVPGESLPGAAPRQI